MECILTTPSPTVVPPCAPARIVVLASGTGSLLDALLAAAAAPGYPGSVVGVVADRSCRALEIAAAAGLDRIWPDLQTDFTQVAQVSSANVTLEMLFDVVELAPGVEFSDVEAKTGAPLRALASA